MKLITISGLDGSGKSTQIQLLQNYLESQNKRVFYFHAIEFGLAKKLVDFRNKYCLICKLSGKCQVYKEKSVTQAKALQIFLRKIFLRIDIWRFGLLRSKLRNSGYDYILSDRYFYDSVVNIEYLENNREGREFASQAKERIYAFPTADIAVYLNISPEIIMQRQRVPDQGLEYLKTKKELYDKYAATWNLKIIDGNQELNIIQKDIVKLLNG